MSQYFIYLVELNIFIGRYCYLLDLFVVSSKNRKVTKMFY